MTELPITTSDLLEENRETFKAIQQRLEAALAAIEEHDLKAAIVFVKQARNHAEYSQ